MTLDDRVPALAFLGLTPRQTRFIALVALHSGYCLRRQYLRFAGLRYGKNVREFLDGLVDRGLATRFEFAATAATSITSAHGRSIARSTRKRIAIDGTRARR
jgi:hypothetical protein